MIWAVLAALAAVAMAPLGWALWRATAARGRAAAAMELHRAQLAELDRDLAQDRIGAPEHAIARLEIERRLLAEASVQEGDLRSSRLPLALTMLILPLAALLLYLPGSAPNLPAMPLAGRLREARARSAEAETLIGELEAKIATLDQKSDAARQGFVLLGNLEDTRGNLAAAADAWNQALSIRFDATLAAQVAEARSRVEGSVSPQSAELFRQALAAAPADAPWRAVAQQRLASLSPAPASSPAPPSTPVPPPPVPPR